jgi:hypothetical protein
MDRRERDIEKMKAKKDEERRRARHEREQELERTRHERGHHRDSEDSHSRERGRERERERESDARKKRYSDLKEERMRTKLAIPKPPIPNFDELREANREKKRKKMEGMENAERCGSRFTLLLMLVCSEEEVPTAPAAFDLHELYQMENGSVQSIIEEDEPIVGPTLPTQDNLVA